MIAGMTLDDDFSTRKALSLAGPVCGQPVSGISMDCHPAASGRDRSPRATMAMNFNGSAAQFAAGACAGVSMNDHFSMR